MPDERFFCPNDGTELTEHVQTDAKTSEEGTIYGQCPSCGMEWERASDLSVTVFDDTEYRRLIEITALHDETVRG